MKLNLTDLEKRYEDFTASVVAKCEVATSIAGGQPATEDGIRAFVVHHLKISDPQEIESAVKRIMAEEVGEANVPEPEGELDERLTYGINVVRRDEIGPYLGNWMIHACLKQAASRLKLFTKKQGSKGDMSEAGRVLAAGVSKVKGGDERRIYLVGPDGVSPASTHFEKFHGRVQGAQGSKSIIHDSEVVDPGSLFGFEYRFLKGTLTENEIADVLALMMTVGLGSVKSLGQGRIRVLEAEITQPVRPILGKEAKADADKTAPTKKDKKDQPAVQQPS